MARAHQAVGFAGAAGGRHGRMVVARCCLAGCARRIGQSWPMALQI